MITKLKLAGAAVALVAALMPSSAPAVIGGKPDGEGHPSTGALVANLPGRGLTPICSGVLVGPSVFLTAAHCTAPLSSLGVATVAVTFDATLDPARWRLHPAVFVTDPAYGHDRADLHDLAVILLDEPVSDRVPARLPELGLLDALAGKNGLRGQRFTTVGYGYHARLTGGGPPVLAYDGMRRNGSALFSALTASWLRLLTSTEATGQDGLCYGDSGGPAFIGDTTTLVALVSGGDSACSGSSIAYRLDTRDAQLFLGRFL